MSISTLWSKTEHNACGYFPCSSTALLPLACGAPYKGPGANDVQESFNLDNLQSIQHILSINHASVIELEMSTAGGRPTASLLTLGMETYWFSSGLMDEIVIKCSAGGWGVLCQVLICVWLCGWSENVVFGFDLMVWFWIFEEFRIT